LSLPISSSQARTQAAAKNTLVKVADYEGIAVINRVLVVAPAKDESLTPYL